MPKGQHPAASVLFQEFGLFVTISFFSLYGGCYRPTNLVVFDSPASFLGLFGDRRE